MWPVQVLQRCAAAFFLHAAEPELAAKLDPLAMLEKALEGVWPGCTGGCARARGGGGRLQQAGACARVGTRDAGWAGGERNRRSGCRRCLPLACACSKRFIPPPP